MGKIICEVCGTVYPDSADCCPICGYSRDRGGFYLGDDIQGTENPYGSAGSISDEFDFSDYGDVNEGIPQQTPPQSRRQIFDYDAVNPGDRRQGYDSGVDMGNEVNLNDYPQDSYDGYDNYNQNPPKSHTGLIIFLVLLIVALIAASGFLLVKFILPNLNPQPEAVIPETFATEAPTAMLTTEAVIPCESLALVEGGEVDLSREGQFYLIHATVSPEDTTDKLI